MIQQTSFRRAEEEMEAMLSQPIFFRSDPMLVPEGLRLDFEDEILFRPTSSQSKRCLPNRHGNEKEAIYSTASSPPALDAPLSGDTQINWLSVEPAHAYSIPPGPSSLLSEHPSRLGQKDIAEAVPLSSIGRSKHNSRPHLPHMGDTEVLTTRPSENLVTRSPVKITMPHATSSDSLIESTRTEVMNVLVCRRAETSTHGTGSKSTPTSFPTMMEGLSATKTSSNLNTDTSTSSPPFRSAVPSTTPSATSQPTTPITAAGTESNEPLDEASFVAPFMALATAPNTLGSFNVRRKPPPPLSKLAKSSLASRIAGQSSSSACGGSGSSPQGITSSSSEYKGVSPPPLPLSSMHRKVKPFLGNEMYPIFSASKPRSVASTSSSSSYLTTLGQTPQSSCPDLPSPSPKRSSRLTMKRLLAKPASSFPPNSRRSKFSNRVGEGSSVNPKANGSERSPSAGEKRESGETRTCDPVGGTDCPGRIFDSGHSVYPQSPSSSIGDTQPSRPPLENNLKDSKMGTTQREDTDNKLGKRLRNVLRKRSHPRIIRMSQSMSTLGRSPSQSDPDGRKFAASHTKDHEGLVHRRRPDDIDGISVNQPQSVAVPTHSKPEILHSSTGFPNGPPTTPQPSKGVSTVQGRVAQQLEESLGSGRRHRGDMNNVERLTPAALIAMECRAKAQEGSGDPDEGYVVPDPQRGSKTDGPACGGMSTKDRSLLRSASMSKIQSNPASEVQNTEKMPHEWDRCRHWAGLRARQSLRLSIPRFPNESDEEKLRKSAAQGSSKSGGGRLRKLIRKLSEGISGHKRDEHPPALPIRSISTPMALSELGGDQSPSHSKRRAGTKNQVSVGPYTIPPLPKQAVAAPLDLHIVNPSVLDQTYHEDEKILQEDLPDPSKPQNLPVLPTSSPKILQEGEWIRSNSPDLELAALPLPPRRAPKVSTSPPAQSVISLEAEEINVTHSSSPLFPVFSVDNTINTFPAREPSSTSATRSAFSANSNFQNLLQPRGVSNSASSRTAIPSTFVTSPPPRPLTNAQRSNHKPTLGSDTHRGSDPLLRTNTNTPPLQRTHSSQGYSSESRNTSMPSAHKSTSSVEDFRRAQETDLNSESNAYLTFMRSLNGTPSVVFRPGTADTFGRSEMLASNIRLGTSGSVQSAISTSTERGNALADFHRNSLIYNSRFS